MFFRGSRKKIVNNLMEKINLLTFTCAAIFRIISAISWFRTYPEKISGIRFHRVNISFLLSVKMWNPLNHSIPTEFHENLYLSKLLKLTCLETISTSIWSGKKWKLGFLYLEKKGWGIKNEFPWNLF